MASLFFNKGFLALATGGINFASDTIKVALVTSAYVPNRDAHEFFSHVTNEVTGTSYTAEGLALSSVTVTRDDPNDLVKVDAADLTFAADTWTARGAVIYKSTGVNSTSPLLYYFDFGSDVSAASGAVTLIWSDGGIFEVLAG